MYQVYESVASSKVLDRFQVDGRRRGAVGHSTATASEGICWIEIWSLDASDDLDEIIAMSDNVRFIDLATSAGVNNFYFSGSNRITIASSTKFAARFRMSGVEAGQVFEAQRENTSSLGNTVEGLMTGFSTFIYPTESELSAISTLNATTVTPPSQTSGALHIWGDAPTATFETDSIMTACQAVVNDDNYSGRIAIKMASLETGSVVLSSRKFHSADATGVLSVPTLFLNWTVPDAVTRVDGSLSLSDGISATQSLSPAISGSLSVSPAIIGSLGVSR